MGKRGPKPKRESNPTWSADLAYGCGLLATDGCLYSDGRHINLTSVDREQLETFKKCLGLTNAIAPKRNGHGQEGLQVQFGDVTLYRWLISIGITPRKTHTLAEIKVPDQYFWDYLRGEFDGDGHSYAYWDTRWRSSVSLYIGFTCASKQHLVWLNETIFRLIGQSGSIRTQTRAYTLLFAKQKAYPLYLAMYYNDKVAHLARKKHKLDRQWAAIDVAKQQKQPQGIIRNGSVLPIT
jgi:hypothetical protein